MFDFFKKLSFISRVQKAIKQVKEVLSNPHTIEVENKISGGINKIAEGLNDIKAQVPDATGVIEELQKALKNELQQD